MSQRLVKESIERLRPYVPGKPVEELERELGITGACKLASNENPLGPSPKALDAAAEALMEVHRYPDSGCFHLRQALAERLGVGPEELVFGNGSNELLELLVRTFCTAEDHIVMSERSFVVYPMASLASGVPYTEAPHKSNRHDLPAMAAAVRPNTKLIFIANPNNPTGTYVRTGELEAFLSQVPQDVIVALDEAYFEYANAEDYPDSIKLRSMHPRLVTLRTFSKAYGLAGLRVGYMIAPVELCEYVNRVRAPFNVNLLAQSAALAALQDEGHLAEVVRLNRQERERVGQALSGSELGIEVVPSQANFLMLDFSRSFANLRSEGPDTGAELVRELQARGVITRAMPTVPNGVRLSLGLPQDNDRFLQSLSELVVPPRTERGQA